jgi:hypothetical protein
MRVAVYLQMPRLWPPMRRRHRKHEASTTVSTAGTSVSRPAYQRRLASAVGGARRPGRPHHRVHAGDVPGRGPGTTDAGGDACQQRCGALGNLGAQLRRCCALRALLGSCFAFIVTELFAASEHQSALPSFCARAFLVPLPGLGASRLQLWLPLRVRASRDLFFISLSP